jgi:hypothetical protein
MAAVAVPLFLHLFNLRRPTTVEFSSLDFVKELQETAVQRVRIKEWLLLALRMLAIACLVLAFARPTLTSEWAQGGASSVRTAHAVVVDNSLSMGRDSERGGTALAQAVEQGMSVLETMEDGDEVAVWPTARPGAQTPSLTPTAGVARDALAGLSPRAGASPLARAIEQAARTVAQSDAPRRLVSVVSDVQRSTLGDSVAVRPQRLSGVEVQLLPTAARATDNVGVRNVTVVSRIAEVGQPVEIEATLVNHGSEPLPDYVASLYLEGERVAQATATLSPGLKTTVSFTVTPQQRGWLRGAVATEEDAFPPDDRHHFTLHVPEERRVLLVRGTGQQTRYVDLALSSEMVADRIALRTTAIDETALAGAELGQYDAVLLVGPRSLSGGEVDALTRYVNRGGGMMLFPGTQAAPDTYGPLLKALDAGTLRGGSEASADGASLASFGRVDLAHPLFEGVFDTNRQRDAEIEQPRIARTVNLRPSGRAGQTLIELTNGVPFLHEVRHGGGALLWMAVAPTPQWSDLPVRGLFVPLLYRSVYYLSAGGSVAGEQLVAGAPGEVRLSGLAPGTRLRLVGPDGGEVVPEQRHLFGATLLEVGRTLDEPGVYDVRAGNRVVRRVAVNVDPAESDLRVAPPDSAAAVLEDVLGTPVRLLDGDGPNAVAEALAARRAGTEIWNVFLFLALSLLITEMLVASQWRPETAPA